MFASPPLQCRRAAQSHRRTRSQPHSMTARRTYCWPREISRLHLLPCCLVLISSYCRSGSVATIKLPLIIPALQHHSNLSIRVILTRSAAHFLNGQSPEQPTIATLASLPSVEAVYQDNDEMAESWIRGSGILHINLRKWAHILVVAPLSANTLAKIVNGTCDSC